MKIPNLNIKNPFAKDSNIVEPPKPSPNETQEEDEERAAIEEQTPSEERVVKKVAPPVDSEEPTLEPEPAEGKEVTAEEAFQNLFYRLGRIEHFLKLDY